MDNSDPPKSRPDVSCPEHPYSGNEFVATPALVHFGKLVCPKCLRFLAWVPKQEGDKRKRTGTAKLARRLEDAGKDYCEMCLRGRAELPPNATFVAHHVIEVQDGGSNEPSNLWHLCTICHEMVHLLRRNRIDPKLRPTMELGARNGEAV